MKTATHTPGPWEVAIDDSGGQWTGWPLSVEATSITDKTIVRTGGQWPYEWDAKTSQAEAVANARLIAAAPDLLEALRDLIGIANALYGKTIMANGQYVIVSDAISQAEAAIAKAEGRV